MDYQTLHQALAERVRKILPQHIERLSWSRKKLERVDAIMRHVETAKLRRFLPLP